MSLLDWFTCLFWPLIGPRVAIWLVLLPAHTPWSTHCSLIGTLAISYAKSLFLNFVLTRFTQSKPKSSKKLNNLQTIKLKPRCEKQRAKSRPLRQETQHEQQKIHRNLSWFSSQRLLPLWNPWADQRPKLWGRYFITLKMVCFAWRLGIQSLPWEKEEETKERERSGKKENKK